MLEKTARWGPHARLILVAGLMLEVSACKTLEFYERERLNDTALEFADDATEAHFLQNLTYSREGAVGGIGGTGAGGGCGCY